MAKMPKLQRIRLTVYVLDKGKIVASESQEKLMNSKIIEDVFMGARE